MLVHLRPPPLFGATATIAGVQFFGSTDWRVQSMMLLCENRASPAAPQRLCKIAASNGAKPLGMVLNFGQAIFARR
jgi:hypothetical protein